MSQASGGKPSYRVSVRAGTTGAGVIEKCGEDLRSAELLRHERHVLGRISHPGVVELAPGGELTEPPTLTTFVAGRTTLAEHPPTDAAGIARVGAQLAVILRELHAAGWAHGAIEPAHCIVAPGGSIVLCSLRQAAPIGDLRHPAAVDDVAHLIAILQGWRAAGAEERRGSGPYLDGALRRATERPATADELAMALEALAGSPAARTRTKPRRRPRRDPTDRPKRTTTPPTGRRRSRRSVEPATRSPVSGVAVRLVVAVVGAIVVWRTDLPTSGAQVQASTDLPPTMWSIVIALRLMALGAAAYGIALNATTLAALVSRSQRLEQAAIRLGPGPLRRWATGVASVGVLASTVASTATSAPPPSAAHLIAPIATTTTKAKAPTTTLTPTTSSPSNPTVPVPATNAPLVATPITPVRSSTWTVQRGDHLWGIAERTVGERQRVVASHEDVRRYWIQLIAHNRERLADPSNPDLIFAGQVLLLPPVG